VQRANEALRRAEAESRHRAEQIGLLSSVAHRIAAIREPEELMQQAADQIRARMNHTYVAVVVLDDDGVLVGRWAGRPGLGRTSAGRAQGPPGGVIGRTLRLRAPQVVGDVARDPDYHPDVEDTPDSVRCSGRRRSARSTSRARSPSRSRSTTWPRARRSRSSW
jgi:hypothetical protein